MSKELVDWPNRSRIYQDIEKLDNVWGAIRPKFHTGQIYAARYPITPLFASKLVNFTAYFRHLCIIEKRRPPCAELLVSYGSRYWAAHSQRDALGSPQRCPTDRPTDACNGFAPAILCHSTLPFSRNSSEHFGQQLHSGVSLVQNFVTKNFAWPWGICFTQFCVANCNFFCSLGRFEGAKKPLRGVPAPQSPKRISSWTLDFAGKNLQLDRTKTLTCSLLQNSKN